MIINIPHYKQRMESKKEYIQMNFNPSLAEETDYHKYAIESVCSYTYDNISNTTLEKCSSYIAYLLT